MIATVAGELVFGTVLGLAVGVYAARTQAQDRVDFMRHMTALVAASATQVINDGDPALVEGRLKSVIAAAEVSDVECLWVLDTSGSVIASVSRGPDSVPPPVTTGGGVVETLTAPQVLEWPIFADDTEVATVRVCFAPIGTGQALGMPLALAGLVVIAVTFVSMPWTAWLFMVSVAEPLEDLRDQARRLSTGETPAHTRTTRTDEIGEVQNALHEMAVELAERQARLDQSYLDLAGAYQRELAAKRGLEELVSMKSAFIAIASHELRAPLSIVSLYAEMLNDGTFGTYEDSTAQAHAAIGVAAARLTSIVSDLMDAALLERGELRLQYEEVDIEEMLTGLVRDSRILHAGKSSDVVRLGAPCTVTVQADPMRVRQILDNLVSNAAQYSEAGTPVGIRARLGDGRVFVDVIDQGPGIPDSEREHLFEFFSRLHAVDSRAVPGLGLGLAISERVARAHGGSLSYAPNPDGRGSVFTLELPMDGAFRSDVVELGSGLL
jgi:signal transduction histidine kinase